KLHDRGCAHGRRRRGDRDRARRRGAGQTAPARCDARNDTAGREDASGLATKSPLVPHLVSGAQLASGSGAGVGVGRAARRARGRRRRADPGRLAHRGGAGREAAPRVRPGADGPGEPDRRGTGREPASRGSRGRAARGPSGAPRAPLPGHAPAREPMSTTTTALGRVLVVDDELGPRESLRMLLKPSYAIQTAENGRTALDLLRRFQPDVVIMDIKMPEMDGLELLRHVKRADPSIEVVMITAYASLETVRHALTHGAFEYLIKPFSRQDLEDVVHRALMRRQADLGARGQVARLVEEMRNLSAKTRELEEAARREAVEPSLRVTQLSILREISRTIVGELDPQRVTVAVTEQLRMALGYDGVAIVPEPPTGLDRADAAVMACAIQDGQGPLGHLVIDNRPSRRAIDPRERELLEMLSEYLAIALRNSRLYGEIADTKRSLEQLIASAGDAIIALSPEDRIEGWNPAAERVFGLAAAQAIGRPITDLLPRGDYTDARRRLGEGTPMHGFETTATAGQPRPMELAVTLSALHGRHGGLEGLIAIVRDIT